MNNIVFVVDVSDLRNRYLFKGLLEDGYIVEEYDKSEYIENKEYVYVFAPTKAIDLSIAKTVAPKSKVFCLRLEPSVQEYFDKENIQVFKYFDDEVLAYKNAYLTAEGAIANIINNTVVALRCNNILVLGYGRLGSTMTHLLKSHGANVYVATDDYTERGRASTIADYVCNINNCKKHFKHFSAIVNTIPAIVINEKDFQDINKDCYILDLASDMGGVDKSIMRYDIRYAQVLGMPAKVAPKTAAEYLRESIYKTLMRMKVIYE